MKIAFKYGSILGLLFILHTLFFYFFNQRLLFPYDFGWTALWYIILYAIFMLLAIQKNRENYTDSGTYFKIAWVTMVTAMLMTRAFDSVFLNQLSIELDPIYLDASKENKQASMEFFGNEPLEIYEKVELLDESIEEHYTLKHFLIEAIWGITLIAGFFSAIVVNLRKVIFRQWSFKPKKILAFLKDQYY